MGDQPGMAASEGTETGRILRFRPRNSASAPGHLPNETAIYQAQAAPDDFRHRMIVNVAGLACAATLAAAGVWLASSIADLRQTQDCVLSGRRDCAPIVVVKHKPVAAAQQH